MTSLGFDESANPTIAVTSKRCTDSWADGKALKVMFANKTSF